MRIPRNGNRGSVGFDMTPMIDIVFQLIIFFLLSSHLAKQEVHRALPLPLAESGVKPKDDSAPRLTINLDRKGEASLGSSVVNPAELTRRLIGKRTAAGSEIEVRIRGDRSLAYRHVEPILRACAEAGVWNVSFAVYRPGEQPQ